MTLIFTLSELSFLNSDISVAACQL